MRLRLATVVTLKSMDCWQKQRFFVESHLSNVELGGVNGVKGGKSP